MEASALTHASQRGLLARRSPLLKLQGDERLIAMVRSGNAGAFETIVDRYQGRLLGFCRQMLGSTEDAEDVLQEVFVNAYRAMLADEREINLRPWLYRIARNRCLNHLRKPTADAQESMDMVPAVEASSTAEKVHNREEFRQLLTDVGKLPETQRSALLLREMDALSYEEIAHAMNTSVPSVKSLLVRARISLAEASQARLLTCGEVRLELAEAAEGLRKVAGPVRRHVRECEECSDFRSQVRSNEKILAALSPVGPLLALKGFIVSKLGFGGAGAGAGGAGAAGAGAGAGAAGAGAGAGAVGSVGAAISGSSAASGIGAIGGALGTKAVAGVVTAAVITAGAAVEAKQESAAPVNHGTPVAHVSHRKPPTASIAQAHVLKPAAPAQKATPPANPPAAAPPAETAPTPPPPTASNGNAAGQSNAAGSTTAETTTPATQGVAGASPSAAGAHTGGGTVVVTVGGTTPAPPAPPAAESPPATETPPPAEPGPESPPAAAESSPPSP
ncbi:MAG TPA: RNA polymerase sigma factor [Solirubrobacterales bacterium]|nr:RNA polymerase sigma factor [Solirubrobacterales bacterium]